MTLYSFHDTKIIFQMSPTFSSRKETVPYNQAMEGVWKVKYLVFLYSKCSKHSELKTFRKLKNRGNLLTLPIILEFKVLKHLSSLSYQKENIFWEVKNNHSYFFWKFKKLSFPSRNRESYFLLYITAALREFPWNRLGEEIDLVLSLALKNRSGYQSWSTWMCYLGVPIYPILFYNLPVCVCPSWRTTGKTNV